MNERKFEIDLVTKIFRLSLSEFYNFKNYIKLKKSQEIKINLGNLPN